MHSKKFFECDCGTEGIILDHDDLLKTDLCPLIYISHWMFGNKHSNGSLGFFERLRWAWKIIKTGMAYHDCFVFRPDAIISLGKEMQKVGEEVQAHVDKVEKLNRRLDLMPNA